MYYIDFMCIAIYASCRRRQHISSPAANSNGTTSIQYILGVSARRCNTLSPCHRRILGIPQAFKKTLKANQTTEESSLTHKLGNTFKSLTPWRRNKILPPKTTSAAAALGFYATPLIAGVLAVAGVLGTTFGGGVLDVLG